MSAVNFGCAKELRPLLNQRFSADLNFSISADVHDNALKSHVCNITSVDHLELMTRLVKPESMIYEAVLEKVLSP